VPPSSGRREAEEGHCHGLGRFRGSGGRSGGRLLSGLARQPSESRARRHQDHAQQDLRIPEDAAVIGFVGRLTADKGLPELLEAFAGILRGTPNVYLLLVGWFDAAEDAIGCSLRSRIEGHPRVVLTGYLSDTAPFYRAMDLLVLPSWREGFPNVILEAAASALPVIATLSTGCCDAVIPEVTGLLVPPGYPEAICEAAIRLIRDPERRGQMGCAARSWVVENYSDHRILGLTVKFYKQLVNCDASRDPRAKVKSGGPTTGLSAKT